MAADGSLEGPDRGPAGAPGVAGESPEFLAALDQAPQPMWLSGPDYEGSYFNRAWLEFRGRDLAQELGGGWIEGVHPDDRPALAAYAEALGAGSPFRAEYRLRRHDGAWRWFLDSAAPRHDAQGRLVGFIGSCTDITDRHEIEDRLRRSEARLSQAQEAADIGIYDWDIAAARIDWSPEMFRLYAIDPALGAAGEPRALIDAWAGRLHPDDRSRCEAELQEAVEGGAERLTMAFRAIHPERGTRWIEGRGRVFRDAAGQARRLLGVNIDITDRRLSEAASERATSMLRLSIEVAGLGIWELDPETGSVTACARVHALFGLPHDTLPRPMEAYFARIHPDDLPELRQALAGPLDDDERTTRIYRVLPGDGRVVWVGTRGRMVRLVDGGRRLIGVMTDVTAAQEEARAREAMIEHRQTLLAELNHRMKNNLALILSMLRLEAARGGDGLAAATERIEAVADLHAQLDFAQGAGRVGFAAYLGDLADRLRRSVLQGREVTLECRTEPVDLDLAVAVPLGLVVNELVTNAIKYAFPDGRGRIAVTLVRAADGTVVVTVEDDGAGPGDGDGPAGSGLGSRLVSGLCAQIGARIDSRSLPGMRHEIRLPPHG